MMLITIQLFINSYEIMGISITNNINVLHNSIFSDYIIFRAIIHHYYAMIIALMY